MEVSDMFGNCSTIVFSNKAYNAIIRESFDKDPVETGGILLGHALDNGVWIVMEVLPPGINCIFEYAYFEYDDAFVNYLAQSVANQYSIPLELLGLWHRHPRSMDTFSSTDDHTNETFAAMSNSGAISGLVNIDPSFRLTMYHLDNPRKVGYGREIQYNKIDFEVGDDIIPDKYFELRYYGGDGYDLHPFVQKNTRAGERPDICSSHHEPQKSEAKLSVGQRIDKTIDYFKNHSYILIVVLSLLLAPALNYAWKHLKTIPRQTIEWLKSKQDARKETDINDIPVSSVQFPTDENADMYSATDDSESNGEGVLNTTICDATVVENDCDLDAQCEAMVLEITNGNYSDSCQLKVGGSHTLGITTNNIVNEKVVWASSDSTIVSVNQSGKIKAQKVGSAFIYVKYMSLIDSINVTIR